jgi:outer membrane protein OmpA-like peptidoglycan-associated protein
MKFWLLLFFFFLFSCFLVFVTLHQKTEEIHNKYIKKVALTKVQMVSAKGYLKAKKLYVPKRSFILATREIKKILLKDPFLFELNDSSFLVKTTLLKITKVVNHVKEDVVLSILAHTDVTGTAKHNLRLSQKRADRLKAYFVGKTNLPLVVAIGYGEIFSLDQSLIEINLKRITQ